MGARTEQYAKQFEQAHAAVIAMVEACADAQWRTKATAEGWPVCVVAHHIGGAHAPVSGMAVAIANSQPVPPLTMEMIDHGNAKHAEEFASCTKADALK